MIDLTTYATELADDLCGNILPFYDRLAMDHTHGGFVGLITNDGTISAEAPKGLVQQTRLLWTFSAAYRQLGNPRYKTLADHAYDFVMTHLWDSAEGGLFWLVAADGTPIDTYKMIYGQAFGIYALAEYARATGNEASLDSAETLFDLLETHATDAELGGYFEVCERDWTTKTDLNVDEIEAAEPVRKTMNTHLHLLEAYTTLYQTLPISAEIRARVGNRLAALIHLHLNRIIDRQRHHLQLHFSQQWRTLSDHVSFGHDIEASWLLVEAAEALGDAELIALCKEEALAMACVTRREGLTARAGLLEGPHPGDNDAIEWWVQAEAMVGFMNAYELGRDPRDLAASLACWQRVKEVYIDPEHGEWYFAAAPNGTIVTNEKTSQWKAPYHNGRACLELLRRINHIPA